MKTYKLQVNTRFFKTNLPSNYFLSPKANNDSSRNLYQKYQNNHKFINLF